MTHSKAALQLFNQSRTLISEVESVQEAVSKISEIYQIANVTYILAQTIMEQVDAPFLRSTYPANWIARYITCNYAKIDPVLVQGFRRHEPFHWDELTFNAAAIELMADAYAHGLGLSGYAIPVTDRAGRRAMLVLNSFETHTWRHTVSKHASHWKKLAEALHQKAVIELYGESDPVPRLTRREVESLHWAALGKDAKAIAAELSISDHTARDYLKSARQKLHCANIPEAIAKAMQLRIISPHLDPLPELPRSDTQQTQTVERGFRPIPANGLAQAPFDHYTRLMAKCLEFRHDAKETRDERICYILDSLIEALAERANIKAIEDLASVFANNQTRNH